jgi:hypothetical protein
VVFADFSIWLQVVVKLLGEWAIQPDFPKPSYSNFPEPTVVDTDPMRLGGGPAVSVVQTVAASTHTMMLTSDGKLFVCGTNDHGQVCVVF